MKNLDYFRYTLVLSWSIGQDEYSKKWDFDDPKYFKDCVRRAMKYADKRNLDCYTIAIKENGLFINSKTLKNGNSEGFLDHH